MLHTYKQYVAIIAPDVTGTRFLSMFNTKHDWWCFAGSKMNDGELPIAAAARELKEETGISALGLQFLNKYIGIAQDGEEWLGHYFVLTDSEGRAVITEPDKFSAVRYLSQQEMLDEDMHPEYEAVRDFYIMKIGGKAA